MRRRWIVLWVGSWLLAAGLAQTPGAAPAATMRIGIVGLDSSHSVAFTEMLNDPKAPGHVSGARVVCAFPGGSPDVAMSASRLAGFTREMREKYGVEIVTSLPALVSKVDAIMILSVDGRAHLPQARAVFGSGKPVYIDKPLAASYGDGRAILQLALKTGTPIFSASAARYYANVVACKNDPGLGRITGCDSYSPAPLEPHNPGLFWYGVHAVEMLYSVLGPGCDSVRCWHTDQTDLVVGHWSDGRIGTVRGLRNGSHPYGVEVFGTRGVRASACDTRPENYEGLVQQIVRFFHTRRSPVSDGEMLEVLRFMQAAEISQQHGGRPVRLRDVH